MTESLGVLQTGGGSIEVAERIVNVLRHYYAEVVFVVPLTIDLLVSWLTKYKFKNWTETRTRKLAVTAAMREQQAREIEKA